MYDFSYQISMMVRFLLSHIENKLDHINNVSLQCKPAFQFSYFPFGTPPASREGKAQNWHCIKGKCRQPRAAQYKFYTLARFKLLLNVDITILYLYTDINSLHVTQIELLHNDTFCST